MSVKCSTHYATVLFILHYAKGNLFNGLHLCNTPKFNFLEREILNFKGGQSNNFGET